jgi:hypothetical protein
MPQPRAKLRTDGNRPEAEEACEIHARVTAVYETLRILCVLRQNFCN